MVNCGIIGFGKMGKIRADAIERSGRGNIVSIYDPNFSCTNEKYKTVNTKSEILSSGNIDAVFICTPNHLNKPTTIGALESGKHVFCEKPPAFSGHDVEEIKEVEEKSGEKLMYGFNHRHHRSIDNMKSMIESGEYGDILWMRGRYGKSVDESFFDTWRADIDRAGGGILLDQGIHMLDLFIHLSNGFDEVKSYVSNLYWKLEGIEDNAFVIMKNNKDGTVASLHSTMTQWRHLFALEVFLEEGYLVLNGLKTSSGTYGDEVLSIAKNRTTAPAATWRDEEKITYDTNNCWRSEIDHFFDAIEKGNRIENGNSDDALEVMNMIDMIYNEDGVLR